MSKRIVGISGSPRRGGNTDIILREALVAAEKEGANVELIRLSDYKMQPCDGCHTCVETEVCIMEDDAESLYKKIITADGVILGSPVYFQGVTAQMKLFIDRIGFLCLARGRKDFEGKIGGVVAVGRRSGFDSTCGQMLNFLTATRMIVTSGGRVFAVAREKGEVIKDSEGMDAARYLGNMMAKTVDATAGLRRNR